MNETCTDGDLPGKGGGGVIQTRTENGSIPRTANLDGHLEMGNVHKNMNFYISLISLKVGLGNPTETRTGTP